MDDVIWWCASRAQARASLRCVRSFVEERLRVEVKANAMIQRSSCGVSFLGFRICPGTLGLSRRRQRRYQVARRYWESAYLRGEIDSLALQHNGTAALAITAHADCRAWRSRDLRCHPAVDA